ncbi:hypothetical protein P153DRAFT_395115 [Dothidotthia symphoricarpi CBS 119687]|uniref:Uncharacterized protein n=1 Tax=Dothidotthia symphoricarpi CBS 119687 TaxID=1392245 RepID=A0A6A6ALJ6_9PLEO|nr:uncharacterized protein P153DRAFT_395115 [Dothidotthia symphoricarpi CBS 119687]KAF2131814.1 hypothetical protein P153DRAFT_395115 [Dothidotthia symphoricarpi CBS 119687]
MTIFYKANNDITLGPWKRVTWNDIKKLLSNVHGEDSQSSEHEIQCETLTIRISKAQLLLTGVLIIHERRLASATIAITSAGILVRAEVDAWDVEDDRYIIINNAVLTLMIGRATAATSGKPKESASSAPAQRGWNGGLEVAGQMTIKEGVSKPIHIQVTLAIGKQNKQWYWVVCGRMESDISLRDIVSSVDENSELDVRLKSVCLVASSVNDPKGNINSNGYVIKQGFFLWATLEQIPLIKIGGAVKEPAKGDTTQLAVGWEKGSGLPSVSIMLPPSMKIDIGPCFRSNRFELQIGNKIGVKFVGGYQIRTDDRSEWLQFQLAATVNPEKVSGELIFSGYVNNPFGLSKQITIGPKLAAALSFNWVQLATTGTPMGGGILASFYIGEIIPANAYTKGLYICENPKDMLIKVDAPLMDYYKLIEFVGAVMDRKVPATDMQILQLKDVEIYASLGVSFANEYFPAGFRFKGTIIVFDHEAGMDCSLTTEGFRLKAWLQTIELGPLKIGGNVALPHKPGVTFAVLDFELNLKTQKLFLSGFVEIFSLRASIDLYIQLMPDPAFYFNFQLKWSDLLNIKAQAFMVSNTQEKNLSKRLASADWTIDVAIEQTIIQQMVETIRKALEKIHEAAKAKIESAQKSVAETEAKYKAAIEVAQASLTAKSLELKKRNNALDLQIAALDQDTAKGTRSRQQDIDAAKIHETNDVQNAAITRDKKLSEKNNEINSAQNALNDKERNGRDETNNVQSKREGSKQDFVAKFGNAEESIHNAINNVKEAEDSVGSIRGNINGLEWQLTNLNWKNWWRGPDLTIQIGALNVALGSALAGLAVAKGVLSLAEDVTKSALFHQFKEAWENAVRVYETVVNMVRNAIRQAKEQLENLQKLRPAAESLLHGDYNRAVSQAKAVVVAAQKSHEDYLQTQSRDSKKLRLQLEALKNSTEGIAVTAAEGALEVAKNNNIAFKAAHDILSTVKAVEGAIYETLDATIQAAGSICDIRVAKLNGTLTADKQKQKPFNIHLEGTVLKKPLKIDVAYTPGETQAFLKNMAADAIKKIM